ncbi:hypothetical protein AGLY_008489, partial [Aphis glycines]
MTNGKLCGLNKFSHHTFTRCVIKPVQHLNLVKAIETELEAFNLSDLSKWPVHHYPSTSTFTDIIFLFHSSSSTTVRLVVVGLDGFRLFAAAASFSFVVSLGFGFSRLNISRPITFSRRFVEHLSHFAAVSPWRVAVNANIKKLTVLGVCVSGIASFFLGFVRPRANARFFVVHQSTRTRDRVKFTVHTVIKFVANVWIFVREISILSRTMFSRLRRLWRKNVRLL